MAIERAFLEQFYHTPLGKKFMQECLQELQRLPAPGKNDAFMGFGYAAPYLPYFRDKTQSCLNFIPVPMVDIAPAERGVTKRSNTIAAAEQQHPKHRKQKPPIQDTLLESGRKFPLDDAAIDYLLAIHALEFGADAQTMLREFWRILVPNGRLILIVPNRAGLWTHAEKTPLGHGEPYSRRQIGALLSHNGFDFAEIHSFIHFLPRNNNQTTLLDKSYEYFAKHFSPYFGGALIVDARKRLYNPLLRSDLKQQLNFPPIFKPQIIGRAIV